jgi:two-component system sensor histidine kinase KdpD
LLLRSRPSGLVGLLVAGAVVAASTGIIFALEQVAPVVSLAVVYIPGILLVSTFWGTRLGIATSLTCALAFNFFHLPPVGRLEISDSRNLVALTTFVIVAVAASSLAQLARARAEDAELRRAEADLASALARLLLVADLRGALPVAAQRVAATLGVPSAAIELDVTAIRSTTRSTFALGDVGVLLLPRELAPDLERRVREHVVPMLATTIAVALQHEALMAESVENASLRRSDVVKTTLLRAVSHDLRTPLTSMVAAGDALRAAGLAADERDELGGLVVAEGRRLGRLIDELLDLSRLEAGAAAPQRARCSLEEILRTALDGRPAADQVRLGIDSDLPDLDVDGAQLERAFANLIDNGVRHSDGRPVLVRARVVGRALVVRVVDQGPGIPASESDRIFEPFYRAANGKRTTGTGLGLAIAKGFVEANGGTIWVESVPGQGTSFVVSVPIDAAAAVGSAVTASDRAVVTGATRDGRPAG